MKTNRVTLLLSGVLAMMLIASCARSERAAAPATTTSASSPTLERTAEPPAPPSAEPAASAAPAPVEAAAPSDSELPERNVSGGSTIRTIACGKARCQAGKEVCVRDAKQEWACVASAPEGGAFYACDDASDCTAPKTCCRSFASAEEVYSCEAPGGACAAVVCSEPDGTRCPRGQRCSQGYCQAETQATCAGEKRCPTDTPYCLWGGTPTCVDERAAEMAVASLQPGDTNALGVYTCTKPSDCGTQQCCTDMTYAAGLTRCSHACDAVNGMLLCSRDSDCNARARAWCGDNAACRRAVRCVTLDADRTGKRPPWMKVCRQLEY